MRGTFLIAATATTALTSGAVAQIPSIRRPPVVQTVPPATGNLSVMPRLRAAPSAYLNPAGLRQRVPAALLPPSLKADFQLTPAVQKVEGRGSIYIAGAVSVPNPLPPGFPGQATLKGGLNGAGYATMTIRAQQNVFYVVDCLGAVNPGSQDITYSIEGSEAVQKGKTTLSDGHFVFTFRRTASTGDVTVGFRPQTFETVQTPMGPRENNVLEFWGCQISSAS